MYMYITREHAFKTATFRFLAKQMFHSRSLTYDSLGSLRYFQLYLHFSSLRALSAKHFKEAVDYSYSMFTALMIIYK